MYAILLALSVVSSEPVDLAEAQQQYYEARKAAATQLVKQYRAAIAEAKKKKHTIRSKKLQREMDSFVEAEKKALEAIAQGKIPGGVTTADGAPDPAGQAEKQRDVAEVFQLLADVFHEADKQGSTFAKKTKEEQLLSQLKLDRRYIARWIVNDITHEGGDVYEIGVSPAFALSTAPSGQNRTEPQLSGRFKKQLPKKYALNTVVGDGFLMWGSISLQKNGGGA